ncbi:MAG: CDGSH-type zinc finger [Marteilia pararefringens]
MIFYKQLAISNSNRRINKITKLNFSSESSSKTKLLPNQNASNQIASEHPYRRREDSRILSKRIWCHPNDAKNDETKILEQQLELPVFPQTYFSNPNKSPRGTPHSLKPLKIYLEKEKKYYWCACGQSKSQPLCDFTHQRMKEKNEFKTKPLYRPLSFTVEQSGDYWLCDCKETKNAPFCDGSHNSTEMKIHWKV